MALLLMKLMLVPTLLAAISLLSSKLGPRRAGILTGLPIVAGPAALLLATEQGASFAAQAARATLAGELSLGVFCVLYARMSARARWVASLGVALLGYAVSTYCLEPFELSLLTSTLIAVLTPPCVLALAPRPVHPAPGRPVTKRALGLRAAAGAGLVLAITAAAHVLGPRLSGLLTIFPVATSVLAVSAQRTAGGEYAQHLLRGLAAGLYSLTGFFLVLALTLERWGVGVAFLLAVLASVLGQLAAMVAAARGGR